MLQLVFGKLIYHFPHAMRLENTKYYINFVAPVILIDKFARDKSSASTCNKGTKRITVRAGVSILGFRQVSCNHPDGLGEEPRGVSCLVPNPKN